jgi:hypothetical protein
MEMDMINLITVNLSNGTVLLSGSGASYTGTVDTDLLPGKYRVSVDKAKKKWRVEGSKPGLRFYLTLEGADPWSLVYSGTLGLEVVTGGRAVGDLSLDSISISGEPTDHPNYIQNAVKSIAIPIWGGNFWLYHKAVPRTGIDADSVQLLRQEPHLNNDPISSAVVLQYVYKDRAAAERALKAFDVPGSYTFFVGAGGHYYPTVISDTSAPALCAAMRKMLILERQEAKAAQNLSVELILWAMGARAPIKTAKPASAAEISAEAWRRQAKIMTDALKKSGKPVRVNIGGTGEVVDAINLNPNVVAARRDIPNLLATRGEKIGEIFDSGVIDEIVSNRLPPNVLSWRPIIEGAARVLKTNGKIIIRFQGVGDDGPIIMEALKKAGFRDIKNWGNAGFEAVK